MKIEDIIEALNKHIDDVRNSSNINCNSHLVLQKSIVSHNVFKSYKCCTYIVWLTDGKNKCEIFKLTKTAKIITGQEESIDREIDKELCGYIFKLIDSKQFDNIVKGEIV